MGQPVKLSDALVLDARVMGEATQRSIAGQIEFWAALGRAIEKTLRGDALIALSRRGKAESISKCLSRVDTPEGRKRVKVYLASRPYPHFEPAPEGRGLLIRIDEKGNRTTGKFVNRKFQPLDISKG